MITSVDVSGADAPLNLPLWGYEDGFYIKEITGLGPVSAELSTTSRARFDGLRLQNVRKGVRNIVMTVGLLTGHHTRTVESLRHELYLAYPVGREVNITINREGLPDLHITGIVESVEDAIFSREPEMVVSVVCMDPYYRVGVTGSYTSFWSRNRDVPLNIDYEGNIPSGVRIRVQTQPSTKLNNLDIEHESNYGLSAFSVSHNEYMTAELDNRGVSRKFRIDGVSRLDLVSGSSQWPVLQAGSNSLTVSVSSIVGADKLRVIFEWDTYQDFA